MLARQHIEPVRSVENDAGNTGNMMSNLDREHWLRIAVAGGGIALEPRRWEQPSERNHQAKGFESHFISLEKVKIMVACHNGYSGRVAFPQQIESN
jgi:hypothetical protein